jgi:hypothetical protein
MIGYTDYRFFAYKQKPIGPSENGCFQMFSMETNFSSERLFSLPHKALSFLTLFDKGSISGGIHRVALGNHII